MPVVLSFDALYLTGVLPIDEQHRRFVELINRMSALTAEDLPGEHGRAVVDELVAYAKAHFASEEALMRQHGYPQVAAHVKEHTQLATALGQQTTALFAGQVTKAVVVMFLWNWLVAHTNLEDKELGTFLRAKGVA